MDRFERKCIDGEWVSPSPIANIKVHHPSNR